MLTLQIWCSGCCTLHSPDEDCPGELRATGPERHGWRVHVETPRGLEAYGVLVAPSEDTWRARILTYPNILWTVPGCRQTMKFVGRTPQEAERRAIAFLDSYILQRGYLRRDALEPLTAGPIDPEAAPARSRPADKAPMKRKLFSASVRFGIERADQPGMSINVSRNGMFIGTRSPVESGHPVVVQIEIDGEPVVLQGIVVWTRSTATAGRPMGMGVRIFDPPAPYVLLVEDLERKR